MDNVLRVLVDVRQNTQRNRIQFGNRLDAIERGEDTATPETIRIYRYWFDHFAAQEEELDDMIRLRVQNLPIVEIMCEIKGISHLSAGKVISMIDISIPDTVSALWRYCGYGVVDGKAERHVKGERSHFNQGLKIACRNVGSQFLKNDSPYAEEYYEARTYYESERDWPKGRVHNAAMRKMVKLWLQHLWVYWRTLVGLETNDPYIIATDPAHTRYKEPTEYGWPPLESLGDMRKAA